MFTPELRAIAAIKTEHTKHPLPLSKKHTQGSEQNKSASLSYQGV